ncbi:MAG: hypothetical protein RR386_09275 [Bacteroidaceae bacterium]
MTKFKMRKMNNLNGKGYVLYPVMIEHRKCSTQDVIEEISDISSFSAPDIVGVLEALSFVIARMIGSGMSVKLDGIGTFSAALKNAMAGYEDEFGSRLYGSNVIISNVKFRADKRLIEKTRSKCHLSRSGKILVGSSNQYTPEQRLLLLQAYLKKHFYVKVNDYSLLTGLCYSTAAKELCKFAKDKEHTFIGFCGRKATKEYLLMDEKKEELSNDCEAPL